MSGKKLVLKENNKRGKGGWGSWVIGYKLNVFQYMLSTNSFGLGPNVKEWTRNLGILSFFQSLRCNGKVDFLR